MKNYLLIFMLLLLIQGCSKEVDSGPHPPVEVVASPVSGIQVTDLSTIAIGISLEVAFNSVSDESLLSEYRIFVVKTSDLSDFDLTKAESISASSYLKLEADGTDKVVALNENSNDSEGVPLAESISYVVFVLSVADGSNTINNSLSTASPVITLEVPEIQPVNYSAWTISDLSDSLVVLNTKQIAFMDETSMLAAYIEVETGQSDSRDNNNLDEIYYVHSGEATFTIDGAEVVAEEGKTISVKAGIDVMISDVTDPLQLVIASLKTASSSSLAWEEFSKSTIEAPRNADSNVWNPFIGNSNVTLGLYMLPQLVGGDNRLVHTWEELNIITSGSSKFKMDTDEIDVNPGSIVFVKDGNGHFFRSLTTDIDILIFWEQP